MSSSVNLDDLLSPELKKGLNQQLKTVLTHFAAQDGVTADQVRQLCNTVQTDLNRLNEQAAKGNLKGFELEKPASGAPNPAGYYDVSSGIVTLPAGSFGKDITDLKVTLKVQSMIIDFAHGTYTDEQKQKHPVTKEMTDNLQKTINDSPLLAERVKLSAITIDPSDENKRNQLEKFDFLPPGEHAGGMYDGDQKALLLPAYRLQAQSKTNPQGYNQNGVTGTMAHEIQHGFNYRNVQTATQKYYRQIDKILNSADINHDYTDALQDHKNITRNDEASANLAGFNALRSRLGPNVSVSDALKAYPFGNTLGIWDKNGQMVLRPGLIPNADGTLSNDINTREGARNIEESARHFYDESPANLGSSGKLNYTSYYLAGQVKWISGLENKATHNNQTHSWSMDFSRLGLQEDQLKAEGVNLPAKDAHGYYHSSSGRPPPPPKPETGPRQDEAHNDPLEGLLDPDLQRILDAAHTGDQARVDAAMRESAEAYWASPEGQVFAMDSHTLAQDMVRQQAQAEAAARRQEQQEADPGPVMRMSR
jgi:hypothetical protein